MSEILLAIQSQINVANFMIAGLSLVLLLAIYTLFIVVRSLIKERSK